MIGSVTVQRELVIRLEAIHPDGSTVPVEAIIDTGFNGSVTLPTDLVNALDAFPAGTRRVELANGSLIEVDVYVVKLAWLGNQREVLALETDSTPLIGMSLLWGSRVAFDARNGGELTIEAIA